eukprot:2437704-Prymnesium_polylepis.1
MSKDGAGSPDADAKRQCLSPPTGEGAASGEVVDTPSPLRWPGTYAAMPDPPDLVAFATEKCLPFFDKIIVDVGAG